MPPALHLTGGRLLLDDGVVHTSLTIAQGQITAIGGAVPPGARQIDLAGLLVLPGAVDLHGDAFERCLFPRPGVSIPAGIALRDADRQVLAAGITTAYHAVTLGWEPGPRGTNGATALIDAIAAARPRLGAETRLHLRFEVTHVDGVAPALDWIARRRVDLIAFNDHAAYQAHEARERPAKLAAYVARTGLTAAAFIALAEQALDRREAAAEGIARLASAARAQGLPMASHDDASPAQRADWHALGCGIAEFPLDITTAAAARAAGAEVMMGAPNVLRGGSHDHRLSATEAVRAGHVTLLSSDYHYPALTAAPFRLRLDLREAWPLVSANPARAAGLADRGRIASGLRADLALVDDTLPGEPMVMATLVAGRTAFAARDLALAEKDRP